MIDTLTKDINYFARGRRKRWMTLPDVRRARFTGYAVNIDFGSFTAAALQNKPVFR